jgi:hypothetical protein
MEAKSALAYISLLECSMQTYSLILGTCKTQKQATHCIKDQTTMPSIALSRSSFPFLTRAGGRASLKWNYGQMYNILLSSTMLRVGERGVSWCMTCDLQIKFNKHRKNKILPACARPSASHATR